jgi:hypothetical protein
VLIAPLRHLVHSATYKQFLALTVERLYGKRPIQCLAIDPPTPSPPGECVPPPLVRGEDTLARWRGGWRVNICVEDARHSSVLYICKYFVALTLPIQHAHNFFPLSRNILYMYGCTCTMFMLPQYIKQTLRTYKYFRQKFGPHCSVSPILFDLQRI